MSSWYHLNISENLGRLAVGQRGWASPSWNDWWASPVWRLLVRQKKSLPGNVMKHRSYHPENWDFPTHHSYNVAGSSWVCNYQVFIGSQIMFRWLRNNLADAAKKNPPDCALSAEADIYACALAFAKVNWLDCAHLPTSTNTGHVHHVCTNTWH